jgi:hypothetical protein
MELEERVMRGLVPLGVELLDALPMLFLSISL